MANWTRQDDYAEAFEFRASNVATIIFSVVTIPLITAVLYSGEYHQGTTSMNRIEC